MVEEAESLKRVVDADAVAVAAVNLESQRQSHGRSNMETTGACQ